MLLKYLLEKSWNNQVQMLLFFLSRNLLHIHGNPGDYAWGGTGLDSIITRVSISKTKNGPPLSKAGKGSQYVT